MAQELNLTQQFEAIFRAHYSSVKHFIYMLLKSEEDAEDLAQDVFARLWVRFELWKDTEEGNWYIYTMAKNVTLDFIKHKRLEENYRDEQIQESVLKELFLSEDPLNPIYYREARLALELALDRLPERRKKIFKMSRFMGLSNQEIAANFHLSVRTVEHQIYLSLQELRKIVFILFFLHFL